MPFTTQPLLQPRRGGGRHEEVGCRRQPPDSGLCEVLRRQKAGALKLPCNNAARWWSGADRISAGRLEGRMNCVCLTYIFIIIAFVMYACLFPVTRCVCKSHITSFVTASSLSLVRNHALLVTRCTSLATRQFLMPTNRGARGRFKIPPL